MPHQTMTSADPRGGPPEPPLEVRYLSLDAYLGARWDGPRRPFAAVLHGDFDPPGRAWPQVSGRFPPLDGEPRVEVFLAAGPGQSLSGQSLSGQSLWGRSGPGRGFAVGAARDLLFAAALPGDDAAPMAARAEGLYGDLLRLVEDLGYPHLLRLWHAIPAIHDEDDGLERYRQFCLGRNRAFARYRPGPPERFPAASVLGTRRGGLGLYALAAKTPGLTVENPNQVSAYRYPPRHGPGSPSFSRALVWNGLEVGLGAGLLFLSGTASITGHESRHPRQLAAQVGQTLDNLDALVERASARAGTPFGIEPGAARLRAYVRAREDFAPARACVEARLGRDLEVLYLEADICRRELLFEMDGTISAPAG